MTENNFPPWFAIHNTKDMLPLTQKLTKDKYMNVLLLPAEIFGQFRPLSILWIICLINLVISSVARY